jgi:hypothetical protein
MCFRYLVEVQRAITFGRAIDGPNDGPFSTEICSDTFGQNQGQMADFSRFVDDFELFRGEQMVPRRAFWGAT